jgi:hypothetical protein
LLRAYRSGAPKGVRSLGALQLACAIRARKTLTPEEQPQMVFMTIDARLSGRASNEGLQTSIPRTLNPTHT